MFLTIFGNSQEAFITITAQMEAKKLVDIFINQKSTIFLYLQFHNLDTLCQQITTKYLNGL